MPETRAVSSWMALALAASLFACGSDTQTGGAGSASAIPSSDAGVTGAASRTRALLEAELRRDATAVPDTDVRSRDVTVRRAAARALARIRDGAQRPRLLKLLHDEDAQVVAWAAYGLGDVCAGAREKTTGVLAAAAASRQAKPGDEPGVLDAQRSITRAVGKCGTDTAEALLVSWAMRRDAHTQDAIDALGVIARKNKRLREESYVALLKLAEGDASSKPMPNAFYPMGKAEHLRTPSVVERTKKLGAEALKSAGPDRVHAISALARCDEDVVPLLRGVLLGEIGKDGYTLHEQVAAARGLARFGRPGQEALAAAVDQLAALDGSVLSRRTGVVVTVLEKLTIFTKVRASLTKLATFAPPEKADEPMKRRLSWIRCSAAKLVAERDYKHAALRGCDLLAPDDKRAEDPMQASIGARAIVAAIGLDVAKITGLRLAAWRAYATSGDIRAREDALRLIGTHPEIKEASNVLTTALEADEPGVVATAAEVIAAHPERVKTAEGNHRAVVGALFARLDGKGPSADLEVLATVITAAGKLRDEEAKPLIVKHCVSPYANIRASAEKALAAIAGKGNPSPKCTQGDPLAAPVELEHLISAPVTLKLDTDAGALTLVLDPALAPIATTRAVDLARNGFYKDMVVHRVVPGFVSQFGSPTADGYGGVKGLPSLPCETSPLRYGPLAVGVALAGRDTGSSQLFVTHAATPHLDGDYALIGKATGPWDALVDGDVIRSVTVVDEKK